MALNASDEAIIAERRERVARLRLRGLSQREIASVLATGDNPCVNPETGGAWSLGTINSDLKALQSQWQREAKKAISTHKARQLAEIGEARRGAWALNDIQAVLRSIGLEMTLLGTEAPKVTEVTGKGGGPLKTQDVGIDYSKLTDEQIAELIRIAEFAGSQAGDGAA